MLSYFWLNLFDTLGFPVKGNIETIAYFHFHHGSQLFGNNIIIMTMF